MSEDWDLFAVVRSCSPFVSTATIQTDDGENCKQEDPPSPLFPRIHGGRDRETSSSSCNELQDSCRPFLAVTTSSASNVVMKQEQGVLESQDHKPSSSSVFVFRGEREQVLQQQPQAPLRSRKRKNQQKRTICHVTQENLSCDMWAWRKYGQKPIKGSPYPRNYYRCSSSKGCLARKQVERSNLDPNFFIVTYTGDHTHPRPTHRNSLAGSTRIKSHPVNPLPRPHHPSGSDSLKQEIHLSPTTPLKEDDDHHVPGANGDEQVNMEDQELDDDDDDDDDEDDEDEDDHDVHELLIPNFAVRDQDDLFFAANFSNWSAGSAGDGGG